MNIEQSIEILNELKKNEWGELLNCWDYGAEAQKAITTLLTAYEKEKEKDKIIDLMIEHIYMGCDFDNNIKTKEQIRKYFEERCK